MRQVEESSRFSRALLAGLVDSGYYRIDGSVATDAAGEQLLQDGKASFVVTIPAGFERSILRGETAKLIVEADASIQPRRPMPLAPSTISHPRVLPVS